MQHIDPPTRAAEASPGARASIPDAAHAAPAQRLLAVMLASLTAGCGVLGIDLLPLPNGDAGARSASDERPSDADAGVGDGGPQQAIWSATELARWSFEGDVRDGVGVSHGEALDGATFVPGRVGQALDLRAAPPKAHARVPSDAPDPTTPGTLHPDNVTLAFWMRPSAENQGAWIVESGRPCLTFYGCSLSDDLLSCEFNPGVSWCSTHGVSTTIDLETWTHVVFTLERAADDTQAHLRLYVNGGLVGSDDLTGSFPNDRTGHDRYFVMGRNYIDPGGGSGAVSPYFGLLDEVRVFDGVLSAQQVAALYASY